MIPYHFSSCGRDDIRDFIEKYHYSHNINGVISDYCFKINDAEGLLIGGMIFGRLAMKNQWKKYVASEQEIMELRRLVCIDNTPKNTESWFIGKALRYLRKYTDVKVIISYSDLSYGHTGVIYKASNFMLVGQSPANKIILRLSDGKRYHDKTIRTTYKGKLKPFAARLKKDLEEGLAIYVKTKPKNIYLYYLKK